MGEYHSNWNVQLVDKGIAYNVRIQQLTHFSPVFILICTKYGYIPYASDYTNHTQISGLPIIPTYKRHQTRASLSPRLISEACPLSHPEYKPRPFN